MGITIELIVAAEFKEVAGGLFFWLALFLFAIKILWTCCIPLHLWYKSRSHPGTEASISSAPYIEVILLILVALLSPSAKSIVSISQLQLLVYGIIAIAASYAIVALQALLLRLLATLRRRS